MSKSAVKRGKKTRNRRLVANKTNAVNVDYIKRKSAFQQNGAKFCEIEAARREKATFDFLKTASITLFDYLKNVSW
jgi:hypothetical protein